MGIDIDELMQKSAKKSEMSKDQRSNNEFKTFNAKSNSKPNFLGKVKKEEVLDIVKSKGPITHNGIKKEVMAESYLISAILSELTNSGKIKLTNVKRGTSIFYYVAGQESKLENLIDYLNEKDQRTVKLLKEKKVLEDKKQDLLIRVSLRKIKDFANQINVRISEDEVKTFFKYFLVSDEEAREVIKKILSEDLGISKETQQSEKDIVKEKELQKESLPEKESEKVDKKETTEKQEEPKLEKDLIKEKELQKESLPEKQSEKVDKKETTEKQESINYDQESLVKDIDQKLKTDKEFLRIKEKLKSKKIIIESAKSIRKNKEFDLVIIVSTAIGNTKFFAKYKNKKRCNDSDLSTALVISQSKNLPVAFITSGNLTKKTKELKNTLFKNMMIVEEF